MANIQLSFFFPHILQALDLSVDLSAASATEEWKSSKPVALKSHAKEL